MRGSQICVSLSVLDVKIQLDVFFSPHCLLVFGYFV